MIKQTPLIKICGVTRPGDAVFALRHGADMVGMIFVEGSKREVSIEVSKEIIKAVNEVGGISVGVFTSKSIDYICQICEETKITCAQIYEQFSEAEFAKLRGFCKIIYAVGVEEEEPIHHSSTGDFILFDHKTPGSGKTFNWNHFTPPDDRSWILAGGLNPENVREAIDLLNPSGVDVSSGVEGSKFGIKDRELLKRFIEEVKGA